MTDVETRQPSDRFTAAPTQGEGYQAALWLGCLLLPWLAAVVTVLVYVLLPGKPATTPDTPIAPSDPWLAVAAGIAATVAAGILMAVFVRPMTAVDRSQPRLYGELMERYEQLRNRLAALTSQSKPAPGEATVPLEVASGLLTGPGGEPGLRWAKAHGYITVFRAIHRAEEALLMLSTDDQLVGEALHDDLSLEDSTIADRERLQGILRAASNELSPGASEAFLPAAHGSTQAKVKALTHAEAREALREVRHAINTFRDDARDGLIRARNRLITTTIALAAATYLLLGLVLVLDVPTIYVGTASAFYLVGAITGLFDRLRSESSRSSAVEDFGLFQARLAATPLISGLAAVAGVYLMSVAPSLLPTVTTSQGQLGQVTPLATVFDLTKDQIGLVYAAIFGLVPGALTGSLRQQADRLERDLAGSQPATASSGSGAPGG
jgi:hypothetical protein